MARLWGVEPQAMTHDEQAGERLIGCVIGGRFHIERGLGSGGMADVFAARDLATQRPVAVKLLKKEVAQNPDAVERLRREGAVLQKLQHAAIVRLETFGELDDGRLFIAMELLEGETLGERMRRQGRLEPAELSPIVAGACAGLAAAHAAGVIHRDLKPDNVFLERGSGEDRVKLLDFGISKITGGDKLTQTGEILGTPRYMAPEQLSAERDLDGRTDVYALGVILYEALTGTPPFLATTPTDLIIAILHGKVAPLRSFRPDLPEAVEAVVARAMARAREGRQDTTAELAEAWLAAVGAGQGASRSGAPLAGRSGMRTAPLGSLGEVARSEVAGSAGGGGPSARAAFPPGVGAPRPDAGLSPGTFSALGPEPSPIAAPASPIAAPVVNRPLDPLPPAGSGPAPRQSSECVTMASRPSLDLSPQPQRSERRAKGPNRGEAHRLPTKGGRALFVLGAVVAGALSATLAVLALRALGPEPDAATPEPSPTEGDVGMAADAPPPERRSDPTSAVASAEGATALTEEPMPRGLEAPAVEPERREGRSDHGRSGRRSRGSNARATDTRAGAGPITETAAVGSDALVATSSAPSAEPVADTQGPAELMRDARAALRRDEARECVALVDRAMEAGAGSPALRLRGDCLLRLGDRDEGLKAYERFCTIAHDHPAIGEVRARVESLGGRCN